ncbi:hypothetical protein BN2497_4505 [Janthinobacterium sp. CG23_2]|nr:hypothetical protein BN2497_4505 [Janthinobacterium sp. CG23_2]CUU28650.1 hypothetical protein BN3177_4505 [Janthinobacterium sp. CG23_2]
MSHCMFLPRQIGPAPLIPSTGIIVLKFNTCGYKNTTGKK